MKLFEKYNARTRSRIRRGVAPKPNCKGKGLTFKTDKLTRKDWANGQINMPEMTLQMEEISKMGRTPMEFQDLPGDFILPIQSEVHCELSVEKKLLFDLLFQTLEVLQFTLSDKNISWCRLYDPRKSSEKHKKECKIAERKDILAWINGAKAPYKFNEVLDYLDMDIDIVRNAIMLACESWEKTKGMIPQLVYPSDEKNQGHTQYMRFIWDKKPDPVFTERYEALHGKCN